MSSTSITFSHDQAEAFDNISALLKGLGVDLDEGLLTPATEGKQAIAAVTGKAGSGKTLLLSEMVKALEGAGVDIVSGD